MTTDPAKKTPPLRRGAAARLWAGDGLEAGGQADRDAGAQIVVIDPDFVAQLLVLVEVGPEQVPHLEREAHFTTGDVEVLAVDEVEEDARLLDVVGFAASGGAGAAGSREPDYIQEPGVFLDFVYRKDFDVAGREMGFSLEVRNLLGTDFDEYQELGNKIRINNYDLGSSVSVGLTARF